MASPALSVYSATPRFKLDGQENPALAESLLTLAVEEAYEGLYRCEATFGNWGPADGGIGYAYLDRRALEFGKALKIEAGNGDRDGLLFEGRIMAIEGRFQRQAPEVLILAEDRLQDLRMSRRTRSFEDVSDADLFNTVASDHGLQADVDINGPTYKAVAQVNQSDLAFLRERARLIDADLWVEGDRLIAKNRSRRAGQKVALSYLREVMECSIMADLARQVSAFRVTGWDVSTKKGVEHRAGPDAISGELGGLTGGSSILGSAVGERVQQICHQMPLVQEEARAWAEAAYRRTARRFLTGSLMTAEGDARFHVGTIADLKGFSPLFDGEYFVTHVRHTYTRTNGFRTRLEFERPGIGQAS